MIPKEDMSDELKEILKAAMGTMHELINVLDNIKGVDPRVIDIIEIAGTMLEQQLEMGISYPMEEIETPILEGLGGATESLAEQLGNVEEAVSSGVQDDIVKEGGFLFLNPDGEEETKPSEDLDTFFNLEGDKEE